MLSTALLITAFIAVPDVWQAAPQEEPEGRLPCNSIATVIAMGSRAERELLTASLDIEPGRLAEACETVLRRAYLDPQRRHAARPAAAAWRIENQWLAALIRRFPPAEAGRWLTLLDMSVLSDAELYELVAHWVSEGNPSLTAIARIAATRASPRFTNAVVHTVEPVLVALQARDTTAATSAHAFLESVGYGFLAEPDDRALLWRLDVGEAFGPAANAEIALARGDEKAAFTAYARAVTADRRYLFHTAVLADWLFERGRLDPTALISLRLPYRKCRERYRIEWRYGTLAELHASSLLGALEAHLEARRKRRCDVEIELEVDKELAALQTRAPHGTLTEPVLLDMLSRLEALADEADRMSNQGRRIQANEIRAFVWKRVERPGWYAFLGGPVRARALRERVVSWLAFPPEPEVFVNEEPGKKPEPEPDPNAWRRER